VSIEDAAVWLRLRRAHWPDGSEAEHRQEIDAFFAGSAKEPLAVLLAEDSLGHVIGFAELSIRPTAEGCQSQGVAYLEGLYVVPEARRRGAARAMTAVAERWARNEGCSELASDALMTNDASAAAHRNLGFIEVGLIRCFRKDL
jgi:aminoglycoside 6'-N-acetyltransferase I